MIFPRDCDVTCRLTPWTSTVEAFNHSFASHVGDIRQEEIAHRTAWSAVKRSYMKLADRWVPKSAHSD
ncbi:ChaB family protein [Bradyrhizobium diazoefficiens]